MTQSHIEHSDVAEYIQMAQDSLEDMLATAEQAEIWTHGALESAASEAASHIEDVLSELRHLT